MFLRFNPTIRFVHIIDNLRRRNNNRQMLREKKQDAMSDVHVGHSDRSVLSDSKQPWQHSVVDVLQHVRIIDRCRVNRGIAHTGHQRTVAAVPSVTSCSDA